jgi:hypothetical protein
LRGWPVHKLDAKDFLNLSQNVLIDLQIKDASALREEIEATAGCRKQGGNDDA